jgi:hypothetical protein
LYFKDIVTNATAAKHSSEFQTWITKHVLASRPFKERCATADTAYEFCIDVAGCPVGGTLSRQAQAGVPDVHFPQLEGIGEQFLMK